MTKLLPGLRGGSQGSGEGQTPHLVTATLCGAARSIGPQCFCACTDIPGADPLGHKAGEEDEVQDRVLPAGAAHAVPQDVQGGDPLLQRHDL